VEVPVAPGEGRIELLDGRVVPDVPVGNHAARGELAADQARPEDHDPAEGEPW
jgi:hypothetical protein